MTLSALIRRSITQWALWRAHRQTRRAIPQLAEIDRRRAICRSNHKRGVKALDREAHQIMHRALSGGREWRARS